MAEWTAIGNGHPPRTSSFEDVAVVARKARITPEVMLGAIRYMSRSIFPDGTTEQERIEEAWPPCVRVLIDAYYDTGAPAPDSLPRSSSFLAQHLRR
jgi:hypothetical protein